MGQTADIGRNTGSLGSATTNSTEESLSTPEIIWVQIDPGHDAGDADHLIALADPVRLAMRRRSEGHSSTVESSRGTG
jgi:hypothetical protein